MLRDDVIEAVSAGKFSVLAVSTVDDALACMTGMPAGDPSQPRLDSVNGRVTRRLQDYLRMHSGEARIALRQASQRGSAVNRSPQG
jgi:predicted ATP-dependent protease